MSRSGEDTQALPSQEHTQARVRLTRFVAFARVDEMGVLVNAASDLYYELDPCQSLLCSALLTTDTVEDAIVLLRQDIEGSDTELRQALEAFQDHLEHLGLLEPTVEQGASPDHGYPRPRPGMIRPAVIVQPALQSPLWVRSWQRLSWDIFFAKQNMSMVCPHISCRARMRAIIQAIHVLLIYRREERWIVPCLRFLEQIRPSSSALSSLPSDEMLSLARRELLTSQVPMHLLFPFGPPASLEENEESKGLCIPRSLGLCAYLRALGLPAQLVLACARFSYGSGTQAYHAWTEVATHPINEAPEIVFGYAELMRFPVLAEDIENAMRR